MMTHTNVEKADMLIDSEILPFASMVMKFEMLPPGQAATKIIPNATDGERIGRSAKQSKKVMHGNKKSCEHAPTTKLFGDLRTFLKSEKFICNAIPNITKAKLMFMITNEPGLKFNLISSNTWSDDMML